MEKQSDRGIICGEWQIRKSSYSAFAFQNTKFIDISTFITFPLTKYIFWSIFAKVFEKPNEDHFERYANPGLNKIDLF